MFDCVKVYPKFSSPFFLTGMFMLGSCTTANPTELATKMNNTRDNETLLSNHEFVQSVKEG